jgi:hypothetical protein
LGRVAEGVEQGDQQHEPYIGLSLQGICERLQLLAGFWAELRAVVVDRADRLRQRRLLSLPSPDGMSKS